MEDDFYTMKNPVQSLPPEDFDFIAYPENDSQESLLLELEKSTEILEAISLNFKPRTPPIESDLESEKSFSMLNEFDFFSSDKCVDNDFQEENVRTCNSRSYEEPFLSFESIPEKTDKAVQTECSFSEPKSDLLVMKSAEFVESFIAIKNLLNFNLKAKQFCDILLNYSFRNGSESEVNADPDCLNKVKTTDSDVNSVVDIWSYRSNSPVKKKPKIIATESKICQRYSLRSRKEFMNNEVILEEKNSWECCFDFTPKFSKELEFYNCNWGDSSISDENSESSESGKKRWRKTTRGMRAINNTVIFNEALKTFLTYVGNIASGDMVALGQMWKNSSIEDGMKIINRLVECDIDGIDVQALVFSILKKIVDSFFEERINSGNHELEYKAAFLTVTCISPYLYLDLINYCIEKLIVMIRVYIENLSSENSSRFPDGFCFVSRVLKTLLDTFYLDLKTNCNDLLISLQKSTNVTVLNLWEKNWKVSKPETSKSLGKFRDFETMLHRWLSCLDDLLTFCLREFQLLALVISDCRALVQDAIEMIF